VRIAELTATVTGNTPSKQMKAENGNDYPFFMPTAMLNTTQSRLATICRRVAFWSRVEPSCKDSNTIGNYPMMLAWWATQLCRLNQFGYSCFDSDCWPSNSSRFEVVTKMVEQQERFCDGEW